MENFDNLCALSRQLKAKEISEEEEQVKRKILYAERKEIIGKLNLKPLTPEQAQEFIKSLKENASRINEAFKDVGESSSKLSDTLKRFAVVWNNALDPVTPSIEAK